MDIMHIRKMYLGAYSCMSPPLGKEMLFIIAARVLAIESLNAKRGTCSHMEASVTTMLYRKVDIEHLEVRDLYGTKGEMSLQEQEVHQFQLPVTTT